MAKRNENRPGYKKTKVGWIPEEWECYRLDEVAEIVTGCTPDTTRPEYYGGEYPFVGPGDLNQSKYIKHAKKKLSKKGFDLCRKIPIGSSLFTCIGSTIGKVAMAGVEVATNQQINSVVSNKKFVNDEYIYYALDKVSSKIRASASKQAVPIVTKSKFCSFSIVLPPFFEQKKIVEILSTWDRAIEQTHRLIEAKKRLKKGLMQQLLTGRMRFPEFGRPVKEPGETPVGWKRLRASEIFKNKSIKKHNHAPVLSVTQDQGVVLRSSLERKINMSFENTDTYKLVEPGDFVISLRSFQGGLEYSRLKGLVSPAYYVICSQKEICDDFYKHYFKSYRFIGHLAIAVIGIRDGKQISFSDFSFMKIPYPSHKEQRKIAAVLNACDLEIKQLTKQESALKKQKQGLMQKLLTGEIRVNKTS